MDSTKEINCESTDGFKGEFENKTVTASSRSGKKYSEEINMKKFLVGKKRWRIARSSLKSLIK